MFIFYGNRFMGRIRDVLSFLIFPFFFASLLSCGGISEMYSDLTASVPVCVWASAPGPIHDGSGWNNAYTSLSDASAAASAGSEIWVAGNFYSGSAVVLSKNFSIYGGFSGSESRREERNIQQPSELNYASNNITINSADVMIDGLSFKNGTSRAVTVSQGSAVTLRYCDFTGNAAASGEFGGAVLCEKAVLSIENCSFSGNTASACGAVDCISFSTLKIYDSVFNGNAAAAHSGVLRISESNADIRSSVFSGNKTTGGSGGVFEAVTGSDVSVQNCTFSGNSTTSTSIPYGGAVYADSSTLSFAGCSFTGNSALSGSGGEVYGGAIALTASSSVLLSDCSLSDNTSYSSYQQSYGGAVYLNGSSKAVIKKCTISKNTVSAGTRYVYGGAISLESNSTAEITNSMINGNTAVAGSGRIYGGAIEINTSTITFTNCSLCGNYISAPQRDALGGAIYAIDSTISAYNCLLAGNSTKNTGTASAYGGALYLSSVSTVEFDNLTIFNNTADVYGGAVYIYGGPSAITFNVNNSVFYGNTSPTGSAMYINDSAAVVTFNFCAYDAAPVNAAGTFNTANPLILSSSPFVSTAEANAEYLRPASILVNAGTNTAGSALLETDLAGKKRISGGVIDIGAYERP